jgi:hypothetical protein
MVYQRKVYVKGYVYYELVRCQRDENKNPRQEHLVYLEKNSLTENLLEKYNQLEQDLKPQFEKLFGNMKFNKKINLFPLLETVKKYFFFVFSDETSFTKKGKLSFKYIF